jgi:hypothetical protein
MDTPPTSRRCDDPFIQTVSCLAGPIAEQWASPNHLIEREPSATDARMAAQAIRVAGSTRCAS